MITGKMTMRYYPAFLNIKNRHCLVVGGGKVGTRKVDTLLQCGARVTVVSPRASRTLTDLASRNRIELKNRAYRDGDLDGMFLVIGATNDQSLNNRIHRDAEPGDGSQGCIFLRAGSLQQLVRRLPGRCGHVYYG